MGVSTASAAGVRERIQRIAKRTRAGGVIIRQIEFAARCAAATASAAAAATLRASAVSTTPK